MLALRLPTNLEKRLDRLAKATGRTKSFYARQAIEEHLEDLEDFYLAKKISREIEAGRMQTHALEDVVKELGLAD